MNSICTFCFSPEVKVIITVCRVAPSQYISPSHHLCLPTVVDLPATHPLSSRSLAPLLSSSSELPSQLLSTSLNLSPPSQLLSTSLLPLSFSPPSQLLSSLSTSLLPLNFSPLSQLLSSLSASVFPLNFSAPPLHPSQLLSSLSPSP